MDSKDPDAKPLPVAKMMVHHFLYFTPGRVDPGAGRLPRRRSSSAAAARSTRTGSSRRSARPSMRARYGMRNATRGRRGAGVDGHRDGHEPLQAPKRFYVRTKVWYTTEPRTQVYPIDVGDCAHLGNGMAYDVPGGGQPARRSATARRGRCRSARASSAPAPTSTAARMHQTLRSVTCSRKLFDANAYYGADDHPYNTIRPILHEPGPIANGTFGTLQGVPVRAGEVLERTAYHDNASCTSRRWASGCLALVRDDSVDAVRADAVRTSREVTEPARYDRAAPYVYDRLVPQLSAPRGRWKAFVGARDAGRRPVLPAGAADRARGARRSPGGSRASSRTA